MDPVPTCARHPDVETRLRCSSCDTPICPDCGREAAVGFKCPECAAHAEGTVNRRDAGSGMFGRFGARPDPSRSRGPEGSDDGADGPDSRAGAPDGRVSPGGSGGTDSPLARWLGSRQGTGAAGDGDGTGLPIALGARATIVGLAAAVVGGLILGPVLQGGAFFLMSAGVVGWGAARSVYWATEERNSPYVRALALAVAGFSVAVGMGIASGIAGGRADEIAFLAYPAALWGGWFVVRRR